MKRLSILVLCCLALFVSLSLFAHEPRGIQCRFNSDCQAPLVCSSSLCRKQCQTDRDCYNGWVCRGPRIQNPPNDPNAAVPTLGEHLTRCVAPGHDNWVRLEGNQYTLVPLEVGTSQGVVVQAVPATPADPGYAIPAGTGGNSRTPQIPLQPINPQLAPRTISAGGYEFRRSDEGYLFMRASGGEWSNVGAGLINTDPSAVVAPDGTILVFGRGQDKAIWGVSCRAGSCGNWFSLDGELDSGPTASLRDGRVLVTATGTDGRLWSTFVDGEKAVGWRPD